jgi:hypothetical protein
MPSRRLNDTSEIVLVGLEGQPQFFNIADTSLTARAQTVVSKLNRILEKYRGILEILFVQVLTRQNIRLFSLHNTHVAYQRSPTLSELQLLV